MNDDRERCVGPGCRKTIDQESQWARDDHGRYCSQVCYLRYQKKHNPERYAKFIPHYGEVE
jgi:hypothetical protein